MILESLGLKNYIDEFLDFSNVYFLQFTYYKAAQPQREDVSKIRLRDHTDDDFFTIVKKNQGGLQLHRKNGEWIDLNNVSPNSYVALVADSFMAWTNNTLESATHRVTMEGDIDRVSIQLFSSAKPSDIIEAKKELVDEEHPIIFKPYDTVGYYEYIKSGAGAGLGLKAYLGV
ncbi:PREDICTED: probable 2-oxoglutarate-dependent dioxygenase AOP1.2 [Nicotiana attenuata]|uniref:probable 2-oxoglutarate-dependent dioxygenase AOP1.2 n=1 Tax=Nicotiana attenuata TaxID=49451 RepID=UPI0009048BC2|nr:PREDICTED: probable 2-oxoglutarate-dependent dioxygenase AOP1.2 [Nicotiana attenuata]